METASLCTCYPAAGLEILQMYLWKCIVHTYPNGHDSIYPSLAMHCHMCCHRNRVVLSNVLNTWACKDWCKDCAYHTVTGAQWINECFERPLQEVMNDHWEGLWINMKCWEARICPQGGGGPGSGGEVVMQQWDTYTCFFWSVGTPRSSIPATTASSVIVAKGYIAPTVNVAPSHISTHSIYVTKFNPATLHTDFVMPCRRTCWCLQSHPDPEGDLTHFFKNVLL